MTPFFVNSGLNPLDPGMIQTALSNFSTEEFAKQPDNPTAHFSMETEVSRPMSILTKEIEAIQLKEAKKLKKK